jgi:site-specific DNA-cytosine methylase
MGVLTADGGAVVRTLTVGGRDHGARDSYDNTPVVCTTAAATHPRTVLPSIPASMALSQTKHNRDGLVIVNHVVGTLDAHEGTKWGSNQWALQNKAMIHQSRPRRLTPLECERLMGWPDGWTAEGIDEQGRPYRLSDTVRYRLVGNGVGSPVAAWIGRRLAYAIRRAA